MSFKQLNVVLLKTMKTKPAPLPYEGAPLDLRDILLERVNFE